MSLVSRQARYKETNDSNSRLKSFVNSIALYDRPASVQSDHHVLAELAVSFSKNATASPTASKVAEKTLHYYANDSFYRHCIPAIPVIVADGEKYVHHVLPRCYG